MAADHEAGCLLSKLAMAWTSSRDPLASVKHVLRWEVRSFKKLSEKFLFSPPYVADGHGLRFKLYPRGNPISSPEAYMAAYLACVPDSQVESGSKSPPTVAFVLKVLDMAEQLVKESHEAKVTFDNDEKPDWGWSNLAHLSKLEHQGEQDSIFLEAHIHAIHPSYGELKGLSYTLVVPPTGLHPFSTWFDAGDPLSDCSVVVAGQQRFACHRLVLASTSPVFAAMFSHQTQEAASGEVCLQGVDLSATELLLRHMYSQAVQVSLSQLLPCYGLADQFSAETLMDCLRQELQQLDNLSPSAAVSLVSSAHSSWSHLDLTAVLTAKAAAMAPAIKAAMGPAAAGAGGSSGGQPAAQWDHAAFSAVLAATLEAKALPSAEEVLEWCCCWVVEGGAACGCCRQDYWAQLLQQVAPLVRSLGCKELVTLKCGAAAKQMEGTLGWPLLLELLFDALSDAAGQGQGEKDLQMSEANPDGKGQTGGDGKEAKDGAAD